MDELLASWRNRWSCMLAYAEEGMFEGDGEKEWHFATCARQWNNAIMELESKLEGRQILVESDPAG